MSKIDEIKVRGRSYESHRKGEKGNFIHASAALRINRSTNVQRSDGEKKRFRLS